MASRTSLILALGAALCGAVPCHAGSDCPPLAANTATGGDYTNPADRDKLKVVEQFHFTPTVERLERGQSGSIGGDLSYTLEHFANHHRALAALARLAVHEKSARPRGARLAVDCYFGRAIAYRPDDSRVRAIFGGYLLALGQEDAALAQLEEAARLAPRDATNQYNLGLLYVRRKEYPKAREAARQAYDLGFPLPGLRSKLAAAGQWQER